jgi:hypothetical protein
LRWGRSWSIASLKGEQLYSAPIGALSPTLDATTLSQFAWPSGLTLKGIKKHAGIPELAGLVETELDRFERVVERAG